MVFKYDLCILGGCGRAGLPLALSFTTRNMKVVAVDINKEAVLSVAKGVLPFKETGARDLLLNSLTKGSLICTTDNSYIRDSEFVIILTAIPNNAVDHIETIEKIRPVIETIIPYLTPGHNVIISTTVAPKTTDFVKGMIESQTKMIVGKDILLSYSPIRTLEGDAIAEFTKLPQIIGAYDDKSFAQSRKLFLHLMPSVIRTTPIEAELAKLFTNTYRYVNFGLANEFFMIANSFGANIFDVIDAANRDYPRSKIPMPGFVKGPCLAKDSQILFKSCSDLNTKLLSGSLIINEGMESYILTELKKIVDLKKASVAVLGLTFKKDSDDRRESPSTKLLHLLESEHISYSTHDPFVDNKDLSSVVKGKNVIIIAVNHSLYASSIAGLADKGALIVDLWNTQKKGEVFFKVY